MIDYRSPKAREIARMERRKLVDAEARRFWRLRSLERRLYFANLRWLSGERSWALVDEVVYLESEWKAVKGANVTQALAIASPKPWTRRGDR